MTDVATFELSGFKGPVLRPDETIERGPRPSGMRLARRGQRALQPFSGRRSTLRNRS